MSGQTGSSYVEEHGALYATVGFIVGDGQRRMTGTVAWRRASFEA